jgi:hypothetical protein
MRASVHKRQVREGHFRVARHPPLDRRDFRTIASGRFTGGKGISQQESGAPMLCFRMWRSAHLDYGPLADFRVPNPTELPRTAVTPSWGNLSGLGTNRDVQKRGVAARNCR